jgi:transposase
VAGAIVRRRRFHRITQNAVSDRPQAHRRRNVIERLFCKLKNWRRIATRYDRLARNYMAALALAAVLIAWIK